MGWADLEYGETPDTGRRAGFSDMAKADRSRCPQTATVEPARERPHMPGMNTTEWTLCPLVEINPQKVSGAPVLKGTRLPVQAVLDNHRDGMTPAEISEQFEVPEERVREILDYVAQAERKRRRGFSPA
jgi:uncharacterized protein (DUF433 family)